MKAMDMQIQNLSMVQRQDTMISCFSQVRLDIPQKSLAVFWFELFQLLPDSLLQSTDWFCLPPTFINFCLQPPPKIFSWMQLRTIRRVHCFWNKGNVFLLVKLYSTFCIMASCKIWPKVIISICMVGVKKGHKSSFDTFIATPVAINWYFSRTEVRSRNSTFWNGHPHHNLYRILLLWLYADVSWHIIQGGVLVDIVSIIARAAVIL